MHRTLSKRSSEAIKEVFKEVKRLKHEVRRQALLIKDMQELYELIVQIVDATTDAQVEPKDVEGVTATICDSDNEISYEDLLYENALKERFKNNHERKEGYRPSTPEIKRLARNNGGSTTTHGN